MVRILNILAIIFSLCSLCAQNSISTFRSAYQHSLNNTDLFSKSKDAFTLNPSIVPLQTQHLVSANSSLVYHGFGIGSYSINASFPFSQKYGTSLQFFGYGNKHYRKNSTSISFSRVLGQNICLGVRQSISNIKIEGHSSDYTATTALSLTAEWERWGLATIVNGLFPINTGLTWRKTLQLTVGVYYSILKTTKITGTLMYSPNKTVQPSLGFSIPLLKNFFFNVGVQLLPTIYSFGINFPITPHLRSTISDQYHLILGHWPAVGLVYNW